MSSEDGASSVEYAFIAVLIAAVVVGSVAVLGGGVRDELFQRSNDCIEGTVDCG